jgi:DNA-binding NarL/FixJ family response regulator
MTLAAPRVVIADDAILIREGLRHLLADGGCDVAALVGSAQELDEYLDSDDSVEVIVLDIRMPPDHSDEGMRALERLRASGSRVGVLLLSMYASPTLAIRAMSSGAGTGYLIKDRVTDGTTLLAAVRTVMTGGTIVDPEVVALLMAPARPNSAIESLSVRERDVLTLMAEGKSNLAVASALSLSTKTVESHVGHIMDKLGIESSPEDHRRVLAVLSLLRSTQTA